MTGAVLAPSAKMSCQRQREGALISSLIVPLGFVISLWIDGHEGLIIRQQYGQHNLRAHPKADAEILKVVYAVQIRIRLRIGSKCLAAVWAQLPAQRVLALNKLRERLLVLRAALECPIADIYSYALFKTRVNAAPPSAGFSAVSRPSIFSAAERAIVSPMPKLPPLPL